MLGGVLECWGAGAVLVCRRGCWRALHDQFTIQLSAQLHFGSGHGSVWQAHGGASNGLHSCTLRVLVVVMVVVVVVGARGVWAWGFVIWKQI